MLVRLGGVSLHSLQALTYLPNTTDGPLTADSPSGNLCAAKQNTQSVKKHSYPERRRDRPEDVAATRQWVVRPQPLPKVPIPVDFSGR